MYCRQPSHARLISLTAAGPGADNGGKLMPLPGRQAAA
jgi:hypothetical protein